MKKLLQSVRDAYRHRHIMHLNRAHMVGFGIPTGESDTTGGTAGGSAPACCRRRLGGDHDRL